jgi:CO dehydrogenase/acetyl-CoA synthase alpha subunit
MCGCCWCCRGSSPLLLYVPGAFGHDVAVAVAAVVVGVVVGGALHEDGNHVVLPVFEEELA